MSLAIFANFAALREATLFIFRFTYTFLAVTPSAPIFAALS
jgi:hypothetical protein